MKLRIREFRKAAGLTIEQLAELIEKSPSYVSMIERGAHDKRPSSILLQRIADALDVAPGALFAEDRPVAVAGRIGAGHHVTLVDDYAKGDGLYHVTAPDDLPASGIVAVEISGESMQPLFEDGDILFFSRHFFGVDDQVIGHVGIVGTQDGRAMVKQIKPGRDPGTFDLHSVNPTYPPEYGVRLLWAAPWRRHLRKQDVVRAAL